MYIVTVHCLFNMCDCVLVDETIQLTVRRRKLSANTMPGKIYHTPTRSMFVYMQIILMLMHNNNIMCYKLVLYS